jgi:succinoglycan biosynthesis transport protein ExoP
MLDKANRSGNEGQRPDAAAEHDVFTFSDILQFVRQHQRTLLTWLAIPLVLAFLHLLTAQPVFTARAQLLLDPSTPQPLREATAVGNSTYDSPQVESQIAVLRSEKIAMSVAKDLNLFNDPEFNAAAVEVKDGEAPPALDPAQQQAVLYSVMDSLDTRRSGVSYAIDVWFTSEDPEKAAKIANGFTQAFVQDQLSTRAEAVRAGSEWLEARIELIRQSMNVAARRVQEFRVKRDYRIGSRPNQPADSPRTVVGRNAQPGVANPAAAGDAAGAAPASPPGVTGVDLLPPTPALPKAEEPPAAATPPGAQSPAPQNPAPQIPADAAANATPGVPADAVTARDRMTSLDELETTALTYRKIYESYLQAYAESVQRQSFPVTNARVITYATAPLVKSHPKSALTLAFALTIGLLIGFGISLIQHNWSRPHS